MAKSGDAIGYILDYCLPSPLRYRTIKHLENMSPKLAKEAHEAKVHSNVVNLKAEKHVGEAGQSEDGYHDSPDEGPGG